MADTTFMRNRVEPYMCQWLSRKYDDIAFSEKSINLRTGRHKFDAVSADGRIIASFLCYRARPINGNENTGGVRKANGDIAPLNRVALG